ncbi:MAG: ABC transporter permease subunit [[Clostridium] cellulosi]
MTVFLHEMKRNKISLIIWAVAIAFLLGICVIIYPDMSSQMEDINDLFSNMGDFSAAFGMDKINFGEFIGYFGTESSSVLGLGGAIFAGILGISALSKEEKERTAEFLLTHPLSRTRIVAEKLLSVIAQVVLLNLFVACISVVSMLIVGERADAKAMFLMFLAYLIMHIEIAAVTFGISAFIRAGGLGIGIGLAIILYFLNLLSNITKDVEFLKYITPFSYTDSPDIISNGSITVKYLVPGLIITLAGIVAAFIKYPRKDV